MAGIFDKADGNSWLQALVSGAFDHAGQFSIGLKSELADLYHLVTPVTADLLRWWFGEEACASRAANFHIGERQVILDTIMAHEVLGTAKLLDLYLEVAPAVFRRDLRMKGKGGNRHLKYCLKTASDAGKLRVLQALLTWQVLNKLSVLADGIEDPRFTLHFLIVSTGAATYGRLLNAFLGRPMNGLRDPASSDLEQYAALFVPHEYRERMVRFVRGSVCDKSGIASRAGGRGMIAIVDRYEAWEEAYGLLDSLPDLMVFHAMSLWGIGSWEANRGSTNGWWQVLPRIAAGKGRRFMQVDFPATPLGGAEAEEKPRRLLSISM